MTVIKTCRGKNPPRQVYAQKGLLMKAIIRGFKNEYRFLSNFYPSELEYQGITYPTVEHAYQAAKTLNTQERQMIATLPTPTDAKKEGRKVKLRYDWEYEKLKVMKRLVFQKFQKHADLRKKLIATGDAVLIEDNTWGDTYWGVCKNVGENHLGIILMHAREELANWDLR